MDPIAYQLVNPQAAIVDGLKLGVGIQQVQQQQQAQQLAMQAALEQQRDLRALASNPNASHADYAAVMVKYPGLAENIGKGFKVLEEGQRQNLLNFGTRVYSALNSGNTQVGIDLLRERAKADPQGAQHWTMLADLAEKSPETARLMGAMSLASMLGPDKFATAFPAIAGEQRAQDLQPGLVSKGLSEAVEANAKAVEARAKARVAGERVQLENQNIASQIEERAARLTLDQDKLDSEVRLKLKEFQQKETALDTDARKIINESTVAAVAAEQGAAQMLDLADLLEGEGGGYGAAATAAEWLKNATGNQGAVSAMRSEYARLRNSQAIKSLPPGPATDRDIQLALKGFPPETADAAHIASFLRGMAKMQQRESLLESARAEWVNAVGHSGKPKADIVIDGVKVPAGTTFVDFVRDFTPKAIQRLEAAQVKGRSYMRFADPQPDPALGTQ